MYGLRIETQHRMLFVARSAFAFNVSQEARTPMTSDQVYNLIPVRFFTSLLSTESLILATGTRVRGQIRSHIQGLPADQPAA